MTNNDNNNDSNHNILRSAQTTHKRTNTHIEVTANIQLKQLNKYTYNITTTILRSLRR